MTYCINPRCTHRRNPPDEEDSCQACGTPLQIQERYWLVRPLRELSKTYSTREIFEAEDCQFGRNEPQRRKVIKVVSATSRESVNQLKKEVDVLLVLKKYGGIPQVELDGYFELTLNNPPQTQKLHCLVMEFIEGQNLEQYLSCRGNQPIPEYLAREGLRQIAETLERVHNEDLVHRDIKPLNIMLRDRQFVLIDFGSVGDVGQGSTRTGTLGYAAPEQFRDGLAVPQSDFYALGRTFAHLLTGKRPNELEDEDCETGRLIWPDSALPVSQGLKQLIEDLMAPSSQQRPENARVILRRLIELPPVGQELNERTERDRNPIIQPLYKLLLLLPVYLIMSLVLTIVRNVTSNSPNVPANHWKAELFSNPDLKGNPVLVEDWGDGNKGFSRSWRSKPVNVPSDKFSARIETKRYFAPGRYLIKAKANDGILVQIGESGQAVLNRWNNQRVDDLHCDYFQSEGREYPVTVEYKETGGGGGLSFDLQPYKSAEETVSGSGCKFEESVTGSEWNSSFFQWDKNLSQPPVDFYNADWIAVLNLGSNRRSDGKYGIQQNWGTGSPKEDFGVPADFFVVRSYTHADFQKSKTYRARIRTPNGFQLFAKHHSLPGTHPKKWVYFTPKDKWQYTGDTYKDIKFTVPNDGKYDFHFHLYKGSGNAYIDLLWE